MDFYFSVFCFVPKKILNKLRHFSHPSTLRYVLYYIFQEYHIVPQTQIFRMWHRWLSINLCFQQSRNIGTAAYCSGWESGISIIPTVRLSLMLVITRANKPLILTAGGMYDLSLMSYSSVSQVIVSDLPLLLAFLDFGILAVFQS